MQRLTKIAQSQDHRYVYHHLYLALKQRRERSQALWGCQSAIFAHPLTAFFPWSWQLLQVLHSMHCHHRALTRAVSSGENLRQDGWPAGRKTRIHKQVRQCHRIFSVAADWQPWPTCIIVGGEKRSSFWNWKPSLNQTWLRKECSNINDNLSEQCFCSVWRLANKTTSSGTETRWGKRDEQHNLCSDFRKQCQALVRVLQLLLEKIRLFWKYRPETVSVYWTSAFIRFKYGNLWAQVKEKLQNWTTIKNIDYIS